MLLGLVSATLLACLPLNAFAKAAPKLDRITTGSVLQAVAADFSSVAVKNALDALSNNNYELARKLRDDLKSGSLEHKTVSWALAFYAGMKLPSNDVALAAQIAADWPGAETLRINSEKALANENPSAEQIISAFDGTPPQSFDGALLLAKALKNKGDTDGAAAALKPLWLKAKLEAAEEKAVLEEFGTIIPAAAHRVRMQAMLYDDRVTSAGRVAGPAGLTALYKAWAAVIRKDANAGALLDAVPEKQRIAGYYFAKARYLRRNERTSQAASVMLSAPRDQAGLIDANEWWNEQQILARDLIDLKK
ncbi:MAG: lytic transglycosylase domain-containing protein, partial [Notoacmeibacter sp.]